MTTERNYTSLNLDRNLITSVIDRFVTENTLAIREQGNRPGGEGTRIVIGRVGIEDATVDIYFNRDGTSTLQWKMGKNRELGLALSDALYDTINPDEFQSVNMTIIGVARNDIQSIIELIPTDDNLIFEVAEEPIAAGIRWRIRCQNHGDTLTVTHYTSRKLQIRAGPYPATENWSTCSLTFSIWLG
ncbi:type II toxin-antitoxin system RnlA family toxin [Edwardsiella anguillarum]|nr:type II toxin-antitoxin system RnlA family toxin [Edwardsiella anguillarum]